MKRGTTPQTTDASIVATELEPHAYPSGIDQVIVNGVQAVVDGEETGRRAGRLLRRER